MEQVQASSALSHLYEQQGRIANAALDTSGTNTKSLFGVSAFGFGIPAPSFLQTGSQKEAIEAKKKYDELMPELDKIAKSIEKALDQAYSGGTGVSQGSANAADQASQKVQDLVNTNGEAVTKTNDKWYRA